MTLFRTSISACEITFQTIPQLVQKWPRVQEIFSQKGFVILTPTSTDKEIALRLSRLFGYIQGHVRAPTDGVVEIRSQLLGNNSQQIISDIEFFAHTDGAYLRGMAEKNGRVYHVGPPKMISLQCAQPAKQGGETFLVDCQKILADAFEKKCRIVAELASCHFAICRENHLVVDVPVIEKLSKGLYKIRFSYDQDIYASKKTLKLIELFNRNYVQNDAYITYFPLKERQILVVDNHRYLHGRTKIEGNRLLRRIWIQDERISHSIQNPKRSLYFGSKTSTSAFERFQPYLGLKMPFHSPKVGSISTGIRL